MRMIENEAIGSAAAREMEIGASTEQLVSYVRFDFFRADDDVHTAKYSPNTSFLDSKVCEKPREVDVRSAHASYGVHYGIEFADDGHVLDKFGCQFSLHLRITAKRTAPFTRRPYGGTDDA